MGHGAASTITGRHIINSRIGCAVFLFLLERNVIIMKHLNNAWFLMLLVLVLCDYVTTTYGMTLAGVGEKNALPRYYMELGMFPLFAMAVLLLFVCLEVILRSISKDEGLQIRMKLLVGTFMFVNTVLNNVTVIAMVK